MSLKLGLAGLLLLMLLVFVAQNTQVVEIRFLFWKLEMSRALLLFAMLCAGTLFGWLLGTIRRR